MAEQVVVTIDKIGRVDIDAQNFQGTGCVEATEQIEIALGGIQKRDKKPEYNLPPNSTAQVIKNVF